jgi:outer membrane protein assembly factor BamB
MALGKPEAGYALTVAPLVVKDKVIVGTAAASTGSAVSWLPAIRAIDPQTGDLKWEFKMTDFTDAGIVTTASDLLFSGGREGYFYALDARTGALLWKFPVGGQVQCGPMTYSVGGRQYVAVAAGSSLFAFAVRQ